MKTMPALVLLLAAATPAVAGEPPAEAPRFRGLFVDWRAASRESIEAETRAAELAPVDGDARADSRAGSQALGRRVGEIVALGDCAEGERVARAAGDFALVAAVRAHCSGER